MAKKQNAFLDKLQAQAEAKASVKASTHVEIDTMAVLLAAHDVLKVGPGRAPGLVEDYLAYKVEIAGAVVKELADDQSKQKEILIVRRDLAKQLQGILGREGWEKYKTLFPFLRDYWEVWL